MLKQSPTQNQLLAALPSTDYQRLLPHLELVPMPLGWTVNQAGVKRGYAYFLTSGVVSKQCVLQDGSTCAIALVGSEGMVGLASVMGESSAPHSTIVQFAGYAYRIKEAALVREFNQGTVLKALILRFALSLIEQSAQTAVCNRHHIVGLRLCRFLLLSNERLPSNQMDITQDSIAAILGARREGVTQAAAELQKAGIIKYSRGHITLIDLPALQNRACECYLTVKNSSDRLLSFRDASLTSRPLWSQAERQLHVSRV